ncbi:sensor histidine kinase [Azospirillum sp.]|uniref:sensor histidine kinase n=1 Tax=Azospirillum sp. TaxID=34012 RepID=UPI003D759AFA
MTIPLPRRLWIKFLVLAVPPVLLTILAFSAVSTALVRAELQEATQRELREFAEASAAALREPIWSFNRASIEGVLAGMLSHPDVLCARQSDRLTGRTLTAPNPDCLEHLPPDRILSVDIVKDGALIGRLDVGTSTESVNARLAERFWQGVLSLLPLTATLGVVALVVFRRLIGAPLAHLLAGIRQHEREPGDVAIPWRSNDELGEVVLAFNRMTVQAEERRAALEQARTEALWALRDLQQAQQSLILAERMASLGQMVSGVAHEINTPVGVLVTASSHLADEVERIRTKNAEGRLTRADFTAFLDDAAETVALAVASSQRTAALVQSFKRVAVDRAEDGRQRFRLKDHLDDVVISLERPFRDHGCTIDVSGPADLDIECSPGAIDQIIINLAMNALDHAFAPGQAGRVRVEFQPDGEDAVELRCSDNGRGIPEPDIGRIFDPFFTTRRADGKLGLGLNMVYNLVTLALAGSVTARSREGEGTTILIHFARITPTTHLDDVPKEA